MTVLRALAPGKLNLTLDILGKRPDGYHDLRMVMVSVDLCDRLTLTLGTGKPWEATCSRADLPQGEGNLAWKAAKTYFDRAGVDPGGLRIEIEKRIPAQAGMAGGSSDAAAVLRALNERFGAFSPEALRSLALTVGSDVPYCVFGGVALAEGRGERLTRLPDLPDGLCAVLVKPDFSASTPALFAAMDARQDPPGDTAAPMLEAIEAGNAVQIGACLSNDFEPELEDRFPAIKEIRRALLDEGALGARLTGSGSVVYGLFPDRASAAAAAAALRTQWPATFCAEILKNPV